MRQSGLDIFQIRSRVEQLLVEEINRNFSMIQEPERFLPIFIDQVTERVLELFQDELNDRRI